MKCINYEKASSHTVDAGRFEKGLFVKKFSAGISRRKAKRGFFQLSLDMFPHAEYFIVKADQSDEEYNIYSTRKKTEDGYEFERLIGKATVEHDKEKRTYLKMWLSLLKIELFMNCIPLKENLQINDIEKDNVLNFAQRLCA